jgi:hypothetical protein
MRFGAKEGGMHSSIRAIGYGSGRFRMTIDADLRQRIEKYDAWALHLEDTLESYERRLPRYRLGFGVLTAAGFGCFFLGVHAGIWASLCAVFVSIGGHFMLRTRLWELETEIRDTRRESDRLRRLEASERS